MSVAYLTATVMRRSAGLEIVLGGEKRGTCKTTAWGQSDGEMDHSGSQEKEGVGTKGKPWTK